jgi:hypothetical protein
MSVARVDSTWTERPEGRLRISDLALLAERLGRVPRAVRTVRIHWEDVQHLDFRGVGHLVRVLRSLHEKGIEIRCIGFDAYLLTVLRFALEEDEYELIAESAGQLSAAGRRVGVGMGATDAATLPISRN